MSLEERKGLSLLVVVVLWAGPAGDAVAQGSAATDRAALEALYDATGGDGWKDSTNWKTDAPLGEWHGVRTDGAGRVVGLEMVSNGLTGPVPAVLADLTSLRWLDLNNNGLTGPIPAELGNLERLYSLTLGDSLTGPVPAELGNLANLRTLRLIGWGLSGPLPSSLRRTQLGWLEILIARACAPAAWRDWLATIHFIGVCAGSTEAT